MCLTSDHLTIAYGFIDVELFLHVYHLFLIINTFINAKRFS